MTDAVRYVADAVIVGVPSGYGLLLIGPRWAMLVAIYMTVFLILWEVRDDV